MLCCRSHGIGIVGDLQVLVTARPPIAHLPWGLAERRVGRYEILQSFGRGGMAVVHLARHTQLQRLVALKELARFHASDPEFHKRFLHESRLASSLMHPNIVVVHDYFEHDAMPYIAMEYVEHGTLRPHVGHLTLVQNAAVLTDVLAGLAHASQQDIVHRDIKPENIMVSRDGRVKIADFGLARLRERAPGTAQTLTGMAVGTPAYMSPEQALAGEVGPWTDLYSVGAMAYEMLLGRLPLAGDPNAPALMRIVNQPIEPPLTVDPELDPALAAWLERMLQKDPRDRFRAQARPDKPSRSA